MDQPGLREFTLGKGLTVRLSAAAVSARTLVVWEGHGGSLDRRSRNLLAHAGFPWPASAEAPVGVVRHGETILLFVRTSAGELRNSLLAGLRELPTGFGDGLYLPLFGAPLGATVNEPMVNQILAALAQWVGPVVRFVHLGAPNDEVAHLVESWWASKVLERGSTGERVAALQRALHCPPDGVFGPETEAAVMAFQRGVGLRVDGVVGPATWAELGVRMGEAVAADPRRASGPVERADILGLASAYAELLNLADGADAGLLFAALSNLDPDVRHLTGIAEPLPRGIARAPSEPPGGWRAVEPPPKLTTEALHAVATADAWANEGVLGNLALLVALIQSPRRGGPPSVDALLRAAGSSGKKVREAVCARTAEIGSGPLIREFLAESKQRVSVSGTYANDKPDGPDLLDIADEVNALADVIAANERHPPLAVGLFGDWGSGKSFFIGKLKKRLDLLTETSRRARAEQQPTAYSGRVVHVDFNAWQYADGNLWANLVHRIFERLASELVGSPSELRRQANEEEKKKLYGRLELAREQLVESEQAKAAAKQASEAALVRQATLTTRRNEALARLSSPTVGEVINQVLALPETRELVAKVDAKLDEKAGVDVVGEVRRTRTELSTFGGRLTSAIERFRARQPWQLALMLGTALIPLLAAAAWQYLKTLDSSAFVVGAGIVLTGLGNGLTKLQGFLQNANELLDDAERAEASIDAELERKQNEIVERQTAAHKELAEANLLLLRAEDERRATSQRVAEIQTEIENISSGGQLREFIRSRSAGANYRQHLGIVSTIREDFENLHEHLAGAQQEIDPTSVPIERVVLYVDDLDRCPADRVVEVLQAVHLLLDFPLFVAVVAVDSRWLLKSLAAHYGEQLGDAGDELSLWASTPQNFLEKIFQIPLALKPMNATGYGDLIQSLLPVHDPIPTHSIDQHSGNGAEAPSAHSAATAAPTPTASRSTPTPTSTPASPPAAATPTHAPVPTAPATVNPNPSALLVTPAERDFLKRLSALVSTPRTAKRLVNLYWLTRASLREHDLDDFVGSEDAPGTYPIHQFLLAIMVSYPSMVDAFLATFEDKTVVHFTDALARLDPGFGSKDGSGALVRAVADGETLAVAAFCKKIASVASELELPDSADAFREPVRRVARFSFRASAVIASQSDGSGGPTSVRARPHTPAPSRPSGVAARSEPTETAIG